MILRIATALSVVLPLATTAASAQALNATTSATPVSCNGGANGTASVIATGGTPPYVYVWAPAGGNAAIASGLPAGSYSVLVTDSVGGNVTRSATVTQPPALFATQSQTNVLCNGGLTGTATVNASGGSGTYTYLWSPSGGTAATATGLAVGNYSVTVTDANSCSITRNYTITQPSVLAATTAQVNMVCYGPNGLASVTPSGGTGPYTYLWSPSGGTTQSQSSLLPGAHSALVTDANGCTLARNFNITTQSPQIFVNSSGTHATAHGTCNGIAQAPASGGSGTLTWSWAPSGGTASTATGLCVSSYTATVTDANSCQASGAPVLIGSPASAPVIGVATSAPGQVTVNFTPSASLGNLSLGFYRATCGAMTMDGPGSPLVVTGLADGTPVTCTVSAHNAAGVSAPSAASNSVTPAAVPGAPTIGTANAGNAQATVTFTAPVSNGGSTITSYVATASPSGITGTCTAPCTSITVNGLANGTAYTFSVAAINGVGTGASSAASNSVTPMTVPGAPTIGTASPGNQQATVTFTPPASNGGSAITLYTATSAPSNLTGTCAAPCTSITIPGLVNGTAYTFTVVATNVAGPGAASATSNSVTPRIVPGAPTIGTATAGNAQATVTFTAPVSDGGSPITLYTATSAPAAITGTCTAPCTSITVNGLANGTAYTFTVVATNVAGPGAASAASNSVTPRTVPGAPTIGTATPGNQQAAVAFTAPASDGGAAITLYTATSAPSGITASCTAPCTSIMVNGLANGTAYTFTVVATNVAGPGAASTASNSVTPTTLPGAPTIGTAIPGNGTATVSFTAPASDGGAPITSYVVSCSPGPVTASGPASPITVIGLANGTSYACSVRAQTSVGLGPASSTVAVAAAQNSFSSPSATGTGVISASFTGGGAGCTFDAPRYIGAPPGSAPVPPVAPPSVEFTHGLFDFRNVGCTTGSTLAFTIVYPATLPTNAQYWKYGPTAAQATPHWYTIPATVAGNTVTFSITDGGLGDDDLLANGTIVDQGGPGTPLPGTPAQVPTSSEWMLLLMGLLMLAFAAPGIVRRR